MRRKQIISLKMQGLGNDSIYELAAGALGLYGIAFFGHKGSAKDKAVLTRVWNRILKAS